MREETDHDNDDDDYYYEDADDPDPSIILRQDQLPYYTRMYLGAYYNFSLFILQTLRIILRLLFGGLR